MKLRSNPFAAISIALLSATTLHATPFYWDGTDINADANGGVGTWDTVVSNLNWDSAATAGTAVAWPSSGTDNDAVFGTPAGLVTIGTGGVSANDLTFGLTGYTVEGGTLTLNGATNILTSTAAASSSVATNLTISAPLAGTTGFTKAGLGNVVLSGNNTGLSGIVTINSAAGTNNSGVGLSGATAPGGITQFDVNDGSFLSLSNTSLGSGTTVNLTGGGGNSAPIGTIKGSAGATVVDGPVNILSTTVRISNYGGTSLTLNGAVTATPSTSGISFRFAQNQGVILTNTGNSWGGTAILGEGSLYCYPGTLPATTNLQIGASNPGDFGTNGTFSRALGSAAGQVQFGRANDGQRANGLSARGGALTVNLGGGAADVPFFNTYAKTGATNATATVIVTDATNLIAGMSVTGSGIPTDTTVNSVVGTTVTLNKAATTTVASNSLTFYTAAVATRINSSVFVLNGANADSALTLENPLDLNGFTRLLQTSANTATLTGGLKNSSATAASARKTGAGALIYDPGAAHTVALAGLNTNAGTLEIKSGTITIYSGAGTSAPEGTTGFIVSRGGTFRLNGGTVNCTGGTYAIVAGNTGGGSSNFILDDGTFNADGREVLNAYGAAGTTTINGGLFVCQGFKVSQNTGVLNLNGGILRTTNLYNGGSTVNFNGGTLQAKAASTELLPFINTSVTTAQIQANGAVIDSNGFAITIPKSLTEDPGSTGGGLTKEGDGSLTLTAANSYTGTTTLHQGTLTVGTGGTLGSTTGALSVNNTNSTAAGTNAILNLSTTGSTTVGSLSGTIAIPTSGSNTDTINNGGSGIDFTVNQTVPGTYDGVIAGAGGFTLGSLSTNTLTLTGANTYTGPTAVTAGTLALVGGSQTSPITVSSGATLGFTLGLPTTSTSTVTFDGATAKVKVTGTPVAATLMTASGITGTPVLDPAIPGFVLAIEGGGTLLNLKAAVVANNYDTWATTNGVPGQAANLDHDNDGVSNGVEYFIGGPTGNTTGFTPVPSVTTTAGVRSITWVKATSYTGVYNTDFVVETSPSLVAGSWTTEASPGTVTISGNNVTYTFPAGPVKNFARLKVTGP